MIGPTLAAAVLLACSNGDDTGTDMTPVVNGPSGAGSAAMPTAGTTAPPSGGSGGMAAPPAGGSGTGGSIMMGGAGASPTAGTGGTAEAGAGGTAAAGTGGAGGSMPVSYTHLTLPTILRV